MKPGAVLPPSFGARPANESVRRAVEACLLDGSWARYEPERTERVEKKLANYLGAKHVLLAQSGTLAMELALHAAGVKPGGLVAMAAYDYPGNFHTIHALGALPLLVDIRADSPQMCGSSLEFSLEEAKKVGKTVQAVIVSHLYGGVAEMNEIARVCKKYSILLIEDACQCFGAQENGTHFGTKSDIGIYSFGGGKPISVGRGGLLVTSNGVLRQRAWLKVSRGVALATPSVLQLAALEAQLETHDDEMATRAALVGQLLMNLKNNRKGQLNKITEFIGKERDLSFTPVFYRIPLGIPEGFVKEMVIRERWSEGFALGEGFRAIHAGRSSSRFVRYGPLNHAERAGDRLVLLDPEYLRVWPAGKVEACLQAIFEGKTA